MERDQSSEAKVNANPVSVRLFYCLEDGTGASCVFQIGMSNGQLMMYDVETCASTLWADCSPPVSNVEFSDADLQGRLL
jgi:hypothetical protein